MTLRPVYVLGGSQTDFARNFTREGLGIFDLLREPIQALLESTGIEAHEVDAAHLGNFIAELYTGQSHLAGLVGEALGATDGIPIARHEAACASGSMALLAAMASIEAGRSDLALCVGVELMRGLPGFESQQKLAAAAWVPRETEGVAYPWPALFSRVAEEYEQRYGLRREHLGALARSNYENAKRNPNAQTRKWSLPDAAYTDDDKENPVIAGKTRRYDASPVTDGAAAVLLASPRFAAAYVKRHGGSVEKMARIEGYAHRTTRMAMEEKLMASRGEPYVFPHLRKAILAAFADAEIPDCSALGAIEVHDCFTISHYMGIDHFGLAPPGEAYRVIEDGTVLASGRLPVNPGGGLMGIGHPVGATGVRMLVDAEKQITGRAGENQVPGCKRVATLNIGGSATTACVMVIGRES